MSGGSLNYLYQRVEDEARTIMQRAENAEQATFGSHLLKVAAALKDLEWHYSGDNHDPIPKSMMKVIGKEDIILNCQGAAQEIIKTLEKYLT